MPFLYIIAGCNGAGKTTASFTMLPEILNCREFVNADEIARGLSPFQPEKVSFEAGRIMLNRIRELIDNKVDFAFETTLSTKSYLSLLKEAKAKGFTVVLFFIWLETVSLAKERVKSRVIKGGHSIPEDVIDRRYQRGIKNLSKFINASDFWIVADNSNEQVSIIAEGNGLFESSIYNPELWQRIKSAF